MMQYRNKKIQEMFYYSSVLSLTSVTNKTYII